MTDDFSSGLMNEINKDRGGDKIAFMIEDGSPSDVDIFIPTGSTLLDYIIANQRNGGVPVGKVTEIAGLEGTGKTLVAMQICANTQKLGGVPVYIDTEHAFNSDFATRVGLDTKKNFIYVTPDSCEEVFTTIFKIIHRLDAQEKAKKKKDKPVPFVTIVWDSVAATPTKVDIEAENPDPGSTVGLKPRILSKNIYTLLRMGGRKRLAQVFVNQLRTNIKAGPFQDKWVTPGGKAIPFASSIRVRLHNAGKVKVGESIVGIKVKAKCVKTRFGPPYRECHFPLYFTHGVDDMESIVDILQQAKVINKRNGGSKGTLFWVPGRYKDEDEAVKKPELKREIATNASLREYLEEELEKVMIVPMIDPLKAEFQIVDNEGNVVPDQEVI